MKKIKEALKNLKARIVIMFFLMCVAFSSAAGDFQSTCKDAYVNGNCTPRIEVTLDKQALYVQASGGQTLWWGFQEPLGNPAKPSWGANAAYLSGKFIVLDGGLTLADMAQLGLKFGATERLGDCYQLFGPYVCSK